RLDDDAPVLVRHAGEQSVTREPRVVDEDVDVARLLDEARGLVRVRDVRLHGAAADLGRELRRLPFPGPVADHDRGTRLRELDRDRAADPARRARDERVLPLEGGEGHDSAVRTSCSSSSAVRLFTETAFTLR